MEKHHTGFSISPQNLSRCSYGPAPWLLSFHFNCLLWLPTYFPLFTQPFIYSFFSATNNSRMGLCAGQALGGRVITSNGESFLTWSSPFGMTLEHNFCLCPLTLCILTKRVGLVPCSLASGPMGPPAWSVHHPASINGGWGLDGVPEGSGTGPWWIGKN